MIGCVSEYWPIQTWSGESRYGSTTSTATTLAKICMSWIITRLRMPLISTNMIATATCSSPRRMFLRIGIAPPDKMTRSQDQFTCILSSCHLVTAAKRDVLQPQLLFGIHFAVVAGLKLGGLACSTPLQHRARA